MRESHFYKPFSGRVLWVMAAAICFIAVAGPPQAFAEPGPAGLADTPWPMFGHDTMHTGRSPHTGSENPNLKWQFKISGKGGISSSPVIGMNQTLFFGAEDGFVYALNCVTGALRWKFRTGGEVRSSPAIGDDGTVYIGSDDKNIYALDPLKGTLKWKVTTGDVVKSSPTIGPDGTLYVGSYDGFLYAINTSTGKMKWKNEISWWVDSSPAIGTDGTVYAVTATGVAALNPVNGNVLWESPHGGKSAPAIGNDGTIYFGSYGEEEQDRIIALNRNGEVKWSITAPGVYSSSPAIGADGTIYINTGYPDYKFYALNPADGSEVWSFDAYCHGDHPAIDAKGVIYFGPEGALRALNPQTGGTKWEFNYCYLTGDFNMSKSSPAIGEDGTIYLGTTLGILYAVGSTGLGSTAWPMFRHDGSHTGRSPYVGSQASNLKWKYATGGSIQSSPVLALDGTVYVGSDSLYALDPATGEVRWSYPTGKISTSSPALSADGTIYVGVETTQQLLALNPEGSLKWTFQTGGKIESSPAIDDEGVLYVGSNDGKLYAIKPNGTLKWAFKTEGAITSSPAIGPKRTIYVGSCDGKLYALGPDGALKWHTDSYAGEIYSSPAVAPNGTVYIGTPYFGLMAISSSGSRKWSFNPSNLGFGSSPAIGSNGTIYVGCDDGKLYAVNPDGSLKWSYSTGGWVRSSPAMGSDGTVYVGSDDHKIYALNRSGKLKWVFETEGPVGSSPAIGPDGTVYVGSNDYGLYAIRTSPVGVKPQGYDFGIVTIGESSKPLKITLSNDGKAALAIASMTMSDSESFQLNPYGGSDPCESTSPTLRPGQSCTVTVTFTPLRWAAYWNLLRVVAADPDVPDGTAVITGEGIRSDAVPIVMKLPAASVAKKPVNAYRMISIPLETREPDLFGALAPFFGGVGNSCIWRLFTMHRSRYQEITGPDQDRIAYGKGWWIISTNNQTLRINGIPLSEDFAMPVVSGYQMIASPYHDTPVAWEDIKRDPRNSNLVLTHLYTWNGTGNYDISTSLEPCRAYWMWSKKAGTLHMRKSYPAERLPSSPPVQVTDAASQPPPPPPPGASIDLLSPNGGEDWDRGGVSTIRWRSVGISPQSFHSTVRLLVSYDGGKTYAPIASQVQNTGRFRWRIPVKGPTGRRCLIRIQSLLYPELEDVSDGVFVISNSLSKQSGP